MTNPLANLHNETVRLLGHHAPFLLDPAVQTYAVAYRPWRSAQQDQVDIWPVPLRAGEALPLLPLALRNAGMVPLDLEATYSEACRRSRLSWAA